jgi:hypothetical protein
VVGITKKITVPFDYLFKQPKGTVIVLVIPTILTIILINNQKVLLLS